jgi:hypothetical protein
MEITIRGYNLQQYAFYGYGWLAFQATPEERASMPPYLAFGMAAIRSDGSFVWQGPLPKSGLNDNFHDNDPFIVSTGVHKIEFFLWNGFSGPSADFKVTDNSRGPVINKFMGVLWAMAKVWYTTDWLVNSGQVKRSWIWGPSADDKGNGNGNLVLLEPYADAPSGWRFVAYYDKTRMEVTKPDANTANPYYVTNGLLVKEMVTGLLQMGDDQFQDYGSAQIAVAGDLTRANPAPTFASFKDLLNVNRDTEGGTVQLAVDADSQIFNKNALTNYGVTTSHLVAETQHYIASPFWEYLNSTGLVMGDKGQTITAALFNPLFYATGLPITEPYWTTTLVGGVRKDVLVQLFERRVLTYTPSNPPGYKVEMGNVGLQYYQWRYN